MSTPDIDSLVERLCEARFDVRADYGDAADVMDEAVAALLALRAELAENEGVISVWRGRTLRAEAERDALREALQVPKVWSAEATNLLTQTFLREYQKHGAAETMFAVVAAYLRHKQAALSPAEPKE